MKRKFIATPLFLCLLQYVASAQYSAPQEKQISEEEKARRGDKLKGFAINENTGIPKRVNLMDTIAMRKIPMTITYGIEEWRVQANGYIKATKLYSTIAVFIGICNIA